MERKTGITEKQSPKSVLCKAALKHFTELTGKELRWSLCVIRTVELQPSNLLQ